MPRNVGSCAEPGFAGYATPAARDPSLIRHAPDFRMALVGKAQLPQTTYYLLLLTVSYYYSLSLTTTYCDWLLLAWQTHAIVGARFFFKSPHRVKLMRSYVNVIIFLLIYDDVDVHEQSRVPTRWRL